MFVVKSPLGTFLADEGLPQQRDRFAVWTYDRPRATIVTRDEYEDMRTDWPYLNACDLVPALAGRRLA